MSKHLAEPVKAGDVARIWGELLDSAIAGKRTPITKHGREVAAVVSWDDLELLEKMKVDR